MARQAAVEEVTARVGEIVLAAAERVIGREIQAAGPPGPDRRGHRRGPVPRRQPAPPPGCRRRSVNPALQGYPAAVRSRWSRPTPCAGRVRAAGRGRAGRPTTTCAWPSTTGPYRCASRRAVLDDLLRARSGPRLQAGALGGHVVPASEVQASFHWLATQVAWPPNATATGRPTRSSSGSMALAEPGRRVRRRRLRDGPRSELEEIEDQLFRFTRTVRATGEFRALWATGTYRCGPPCSLVEDLLGGQGLADDRTPGRVRHPGRTRPRQREPARPPGGPGGAEQRPAPGPGRTAVDRRRRPAPELATVLSQVAGRPVDVRLTVDPAVLGGFLATIGDTVVDGSIRHRLDHLKERLHCPRPKYQRRDQPMAELTINADDIAAALRRTSPTTPPRSDRAGRSRSSRSATASPGSPGCPTPRSTSCSSSRAGPPGLALNLDEDTIGAVVLGRGRPARGRPAVKATGRILSVPVGDALLGRVVNALGEPIDGKGPIATDRDPPAGGAGARASSAASPCTSRCRPASRPSTP